MSCDSSNAYNDECSDEDAINNDNSDTNGNTDDNPDTNGNNNREDYSDCTFKDFYRKESMKVKKIVAKKVRVAVKSGALSRAGQKVC